MIISGYNMVENWVVNNHWDTDVTHAALRILTQISDQKQVQTLINILEAPWSSDECWDSQSEPWAFDLSSIPGFA
jgi:hypothetical protein